MREMEELSYEDIAQALDLSLGSVKSNIFRAKGFLNPPWKKQEYPPGTSKAAGEKRGGP